MVKQRNGECESLMSELPQPTMAESVNDSVRKRGEVCLIQLFINHEKMAMKDKEGFNVSPSPLIACVIRQYGTGLYRTYVSLDKNNTVCLSTHQDEASATEMINRFLETYQQGQIKTLEDVLIFVSSVRGKEPAALLPVIGQSVDEMAA